MGDFLRGDVFRQFVVVEVPGVIALWSWGLVLLLAYPDVASFVEANAGASVFISLAFTTAAGLVLEDFGAWIETAWDRRIARERPEHIEEWWRFLCTPRDDSLPAVSYLRTILLRTKFELGAATALVPSLAGLAVCHFVQDLFSPSVFWIAAVLHALLFFFLLGESRSGSQLLSDIRHHILTKSSN